MAQIFKGTKNFMGGAFDATKNFANSAMEGTKNVVGGAMDGSKNLMGGALGATGDLFKSVVHMGRERSHSKSEDAIIRRASSLQAKFKPKDDIATKIQLFRDINQPCDVYSWLEITIQDIDLVNQQFDCSIEVHLFWQDYALPNVFPEFEDGSFEIDNDCLPLKMTEIFENAIDVSITLDPMFDYFPETSCIYMMFVCECKFVERMELQRFPLDRQFLTMELNAYTGKSPTGNWNWILTKGLDWVPAKWRNRSYYVRMVASISSEYELHSPWIDFKTNDAGDASELIKNEKNPFKRARSKGAGGASSGGNKSIETGNDGKIADYGYDGPIISEPHPLSIALRVERHPNYYYGNILFPNFLIGLGCAGAFVVPPDSLADRMGVLITLMLAAVAFRFVVSTMLPRISYLTLMDKYLLFSFVMIVILIGENTVVGVDSLFPNETWIAAFDYTFCLGFYIGWGVIHLFFLFTMIVPGFYRITWEDTYEMDTDDGDSNYEVEANDYQFVSTNDETQSCVNKWKEVKKANE